MKRRSAFEEWIHRQKRRSRIERIILEVFVNLTVEAVGPGLRRSFDVSPAGLAHRCVVHGSRDMDLLNGFDRRCGQGLADGVKYRAVGLNLSTHSEDLSRVQREPAIGNVAG